MVCEILVCSRSRLISLRVLAFANDGSFLEQYKRLQQEKQSKDADGTASEPSPHPDQSNSKATPLSSSKSPAEPKLTAIERRKAMEERLRNRGKRKAAETSKKSSEEDGGAKKARNQTEEEYLRQVRKAESKSLKDSGSGVRSLVK